MLEAATSDRRIPTLERRFPKGDVLLDLYSYTINTGRPFSEVLAEHAPHFSELETEIVVGLPALPRAQAARQRLRLRRPAPACGSGCSTRSRRRRPQLAASYDHVLVDEYQDTNRLQGDIVDAMARVKRNVTVVGDDAQAIYSFRGASFENILGFPQRYPEAKTFRLTRNYRSTPEILALANASIAHNVKQFPKELAASREAGGLPAVVALPDIPDQARFVGQRLLEWHDEGEKLAGPRRALPGALPGARAADRADAARHPVRDPLRHAVLRAAPRQGRARVPAHRREPEGRALLEAGAEDLSAGRGALGLGGLGGDRRRGPIRSRRSGRSTRRAPTSAAGRRRALKPFRSLLARLDRPAIRSSPAEAIRSVVEDVYRDYARAKFPNGDARLDDLEQFAQFAQTYDSLPAFLEEVTLFNELSGEDVVAGEPDDDRVVLSSIHQAKGLEWSRVIVMGLSEGRFPNYRSIATDEGLEEERRLFYVAVTRAKNEIALVYPMLARDRYGVDVILEPSRFLTELPDAVYERWTIEREAVRGEEVESCRR